jgi:hypothetical protein
MDHLGRAVASAMIIFLLVTQAGAQEPCLLYERGTVACPGYGAPAATAVPGPSLDGGVTTVPNASSTTLFGGMVPPNGFLIRVFVNNGNYGVLFPNGNYGTVCFVNDNGPAGQGVGFYMVPEIAITVPGASDTLPSSVVVTSAIFASPHGYKPMGPVSIWCNGATVNLAARGW